MSVKPAEGRGGSPNPLASVRRRGLKKATSTNVVADLTSRPAITQVEVPNGTQESESLEAERGEEQRPAATATARAQERPDQQEQKTGERRGAAQDQPAPSASPTSEATDPVNQVSGGPQKVPSDAKTIAPTDDAFPEGPAAAKPAKKPMRKVNFHQSADAGRRMRATYLATRHLTGYRSLSDFICSLIERECEALEEKYNDGHPFIVDANGIPRGRPIEL